MEKKKFTDEEVEKLRANPYTYSVTPNTLMLTKEFKELFMDEYGKGNTPCRILEEHGYPADILGKSRIEGISGSIRKQAASPEGARRNRSARILRSYLRHIRCTDIQR